MVNCRIKPKRLWNGSKYRFFCIFEWHTSPDQRNRKTPYGGPRPTSRCGPDPPATLCGSCCNKYEAKNSIGLGGRSLTNWDMPDKIVIKGATSKRNKECRQLILDSLDKRNKNKNNTNATTPDQRGTYHREESAPRSGQGRIESATTGHSAAAAAVVVVAVASGHWQPELYSAAGELLRVVA